MPIPAALAGDAETLATSVKDANRQWAAEHGYDGESTTLLTRAIRDWVGSNAYISALGADLSVRVNLDGAPVAAPVSEMDRLSATAQMRAAAQAQPETPAIAALVDSPTGGVDVPTG